MALACVLLVLSACQGLSIDTPAKKLAALEIGFTSAVRELKAHCDVGVIALDKCRDAAQYVRTGDVALDVAHTLVLGGNDISGQLATVRAALVALPQPE